jgi:hypothetical protein
VSRSPAGRLPSGHRGGVSWQTGSLAFLGYLALSLLLIGRGALAHLDSSCVCVGAADPTQYMWSFAWVPHAIGSGTNPFLTNAMWAPGPFNLAATGWAPLAAFVAMPVTLTLGPLAAYNLLVLIAPALAAFFAFRLCQYITGRIAPSLVGGFMFGFSSYVISQMTSHLHLALVFFIPLAVHLTLRYVDGAIGRRRFVISIAAVIAGQALLSTEVLFTSLVFAVIALGAAAVFSTADVRDRVRQAAIGILAGGAIAAIVISPFLYYAIFYSAPPELLPESRISMDALNVLAPTPVTRVGRHYFESVAYTYPGNWSETGGYLGIAVVLLAGWWLISTWRRPATRVMLSVLVCAIVGALGTSLYISGHSTIPLPWKLIAHLPLFNQVVPVRLFMYAALVASVAIAMALAAQVGGAKLRWALAVVGVVMILPNGGSWLLRSNPSDPEFFSTDQYKSYIGKDETVLALPFGQRGFSLLWQARTNIGFRLAGGYLGQAPPQEYTDEPVVLQMLAGGASAETPCGLYSFIKRREVGAVVVEPLPTEPWPVVLKQLGLEPREVGGILFYRVPALLDPPAGCSA